MRAECCLALGELRDPAASEPLLAATRDPEHVVRAAAGQALDRIGTAAIAVGVAALLRPLLEGAPADGRHALAAHTVAALQTETNGSANGDGEGSTLLRRLARFIDRVEDSRGRGRPARSRRRRPGRRAERAVSTHRSTGVAIAFPREPRRSHASTRGGRSAGRLAREQPSQLRERQRERQRRRTGGAGRAMKTLVIVADSSVIVETIRLALRAAGDVNVIGKLDGRTDIRGSAAAAPAAVVLVDEMEDSQHALERIAECRDELPDTSVVVLSSRVDAPWTGRALAAGAHACVSKSANLPGLGAIIREVVNRNIVSVLPPADPFADMAAAGRRPLSEREREIVTLVADGLTNARIGQQLCVTEQTVKFHLSNIYRKLGVSNRPRRAATCICTCPGWPSAWPPARHLSAARRATERVPDRARSAPRAAARALRR